MNDAPKITPRTLKGFRDFPPESMIPRERLIETARRVYRSFGFSPIDTPALEYLEILTGKGGEESDKQLYQFQDHGQRWVGMRFDLTVPLARFAAQHIGTLGTPFKRYHIAPVWRGENTQHGRFREFMQCDFDTIGTRGAASDIETVLVIHALLEAIGIGEFTIHVNQRLVLSGLLERLGLADRTAPVLRSLDKLAKAGRAKVAEELVNMASASEVQSGDILQLADLTGDNDSVLRGLERLVGDNPTGQAGVASLAELSKAVTAAGVPASRLRISPAIARGLDYYTGVVMETLLDRLPQIGSVCSGGRYDNLAGMFTNQELPGVGASLGLDRLLEALKDLGMTESVGTPAPVFLAYFDAARLHDYLRLAAQIRSAGIGVELYPEPKRLGQQLKYADRRGFRVALIAGESELAEGACQVKDLATGNSQTVKLREVPATIQQVLATSASAQGHSHGQSQ